jgi:hypothetical protein
VRASSHARMRTRLESTSEARALSGAVHVYLAPYPRSVAVGQNMRELGRKGGIASGVTRRGTRVVLHMGRSPEAKEARAELVAETKMRLERHLARTPAGLAVRIAQRILALTLGMLLNTLNGRPAAPSPPTTAAKSHQPSRLAT